MRDSGCRQVAVYRVPLGRKTRVVIGQTDLIRVEKFDRCKSRVDVQVTREGELFRCER
jgi:hypothetical protein